MSCQFTTRWSRPGIYSFLHHHKKCVFKHIFFSISFWIILEIGFLILNSDCVSKSHINCLVNLKKTTIAQQKYVNDFQGKKLTHVRLKYKLRDNSTQRKQNKDDKKSNSHECAYHFKMKFR